MKSLSIRRRLRSWTLTIKRSTTGISTMSIQPEENKRAQATLYTAGDLAASMELNPYLKVFCANGYYDAVTPFFQTKLDIENMPLGNPENHDKTQYNLVFRTYPSGHMIYLDKDSRKEMKNDLGEFYDKILTRFGQRSVRPHRAPNQPVPIPSALQSNAILGRKADFPKRTTQPSFQQPSS